MSEQELMQSIKTQWGTAIEEATAASSVPPAFLAALIAGESGGKNDAKRFEPGVLAHLWEVLLGRKAAYGSIGRADLVGYVSGVSDPIAVPQNLPADCFQRVDGLCTSWGLTQIMGWHVLEQTIGHGMGVDVLKKPAIHLSIALNLLAQFSQRFGLDVAKDFEEMFRCWNTGEPDGKTFDPNYALNGMARMAVWTSLP